MNQIKQQISEIKKAIANLYAQKLAAETRSRFVNQFVVDRLDKDIQELQSQLQTLEMILSLVYES